MKLIGKAMGAFAASAVVSLALTGCGSNNTPETLSGVASSAAALQATISLKDSSVPPRSKVATSDGSGAFSRTHATRCSICCAVRTSAIRF